MMKLRIMGCLLMAATAIGALAQSGTKSPYSQFGVGTLSDQSQGMSRGMNGVGLGMRKGDVVNTLNPASYSSVDSVTMLFDMGLSGQVTNFKEGAVKRNASQANFEYVIGSFRAWKNVGMAFGLLPYSNVGYDYEKVTRDQTTGTLKETYSGSGGLHQVFLGTGVRVFGPLSVGVNASYFWGSIDRSVSPYSSAASNSLSKKYSTTISSYKLDFGAQWEQKVGKEDQLTLGAVFGLGHNLKNDADMTIVSSNSMSGIADTTRFSVADAYTLPMSFGAGVSYCHASKLTLAADFTLAKWGSEKFPIYQNDKYELQSGLLKDRTKICAGVDWLPKAVSQQGAKFLERVHYRFGAGYATPYYNINGQDGPKELSVSAGFGIPVTFSYNSRAMLNISGQWAHAAADGFITENTFRINIGITFNERWFSKWKVD